MSELTDEVLKYIIDPDGIDSIETKCPQGLLRRLSMRIRLLESDNESLQQEVDDAYRGWQHAGDYLRD